MRIAQLLHNPLGHPLHETIAVCFELGAQHHGPDCSMYLQTVLEGLDCNLF